MGLTVEIPFIPFSGSRKNLYHAVREVSRTLKFVQVSDCMSSDGPLEKGALGWKVKFLREG